MNKIQKLAVILISLSIILTFSTPFASSAASETGNAEQQAVYKKSETVYASLNTDGSPKGIYCVNSFSVISEGIITDYGYYDKTINLTDSSALVYENGLVTFNAKPGEFYYQGNLFADKALLPWEFKIEYRLDGQLTDAASIAGKSGKAEISLHVTPRDYPAAKSCTLQISGSLKLSIFSDISAGGATLTEIGGETQIVFTVFPNRAADLKIDANTNSFEFSGFTIAAAKAEMPIELSSDSLPDFTKELEEFSKGIGKFKNGAGSLSDGAAELSRAAGSLADGCQTINKATASAAAGALKLADSTYNVAKSLSSLSLGGKILSDGIKNLADGASSAADKGQDLISGAEKLSNGIDSLQSGADKLASATSELCKGQKELSDGLNALLPGAMSLSGGIGNVSDTLTALTSGNDQLLKGAEEIKQNAFNQANVQLSEALGSHAPVLEELNYASVLDALISDTDAGSSESGTIVFKTLKSSLDSICLYYDGLESYLNTVGVLAKNAPGLKSGSDAVYAGIALLSEGACTVAAGSKTISDGSAGLSAGLSETHSGASELSEGVKAYVDGVKTIAKGASESANGISEYAGGIKMFSDGFSNFTDGVYSMSDGISSLSMVISDFNSGVTALSDGTKTIADGAKELSDGSNTLYENTNGMSAAVKEKIDGALNEIISGYSGNGETVSFISEKNTFTDNVQFVIITDSVSSTENTPIPDPEPQAMNFWQKFLSLFGLYKQE